jgi:hypothetical protein
MIDKSVMFKIEKEFEATIADTTSHKYRNPKDLQYSFFYHYMLMSYGYKSEDAPKGNYRFVQLVNNEEMMKIAFRDIHEINYKFVCINDDMDDVANPNILGNLKDYYEKRFPNPSSFEK